MSKALNLTVLADAWTIPNDDPDFINEPEACSTEFDVIDTLRTLGHNVSVLSVPDDVPALATELAENKPDIVFNLTEQLGGDRTMDKNIAAVLELMGIPFTGTGPAGLLLCRDKRLCKEMLSLHKIRVPGFVSFPLNQKVRVPAKIHYPLVVKPALEDSSEGISNASLVTNEKALLERVQFVHDGWRQPVIAEEYIEGRELYVGIIGNTRLKVLPIRECHFKSDDADGPRLATYRVKWNKKYREKWDIEFGYADLEPALFNRIERVCKKVYRVLRIRDYGRIDLRLTPDGKLVILEANPNPDIAYGEEVAEAAEKAGIKYESFIQNLLQTARRRYK